MPYHIEVRREIYTIISQIESADLAKEDVQRFVGDIIAVGESFIEEGLPALYHILLTDERKFDFVGMLKPLHELRQNAALIAVRTKLNMMTILVGTGKGMQNLQFTQQMMSTPQYGGRPIAILPTLELALESVRRDIAVHGISPSSPAESSA
jgi:hypothetical protein